MGRTRGGRCTEGSIKADAGVALRVNNGLISPQSVRAVRLSSPQRDGDHPGVSGPVSSNELKHSIKQQGRQTVSGRV